MAGSGNSCTLSCWRPPAAVRVSAFMQRDGSERGAQDLLARVERNRDSGATGRRRLQEETEFHPAFRSVGDLADKVCQPVSLPRNGEGGRGILRLEQLVCPSRPPGEPHDTGPLGASTSLRDIPQIAVAKKPGTGFTYRGSGQPALVGALDGHRVNLGVPIAG